MGPVARGLLFGAALMMLLAGAACDNDAGANHEQAIEAAAPAESAAMPEPAASAESAAMPEPASPSEHGDAAAKPQPASPSDFAEAAHAAMSPPSQPDERDDAPSTPSLDELNPAGTTVTLAGRYEVPVVSAGRQPPPSPLTKAEGYHPPDDPEADAVTRGYRLVGLNEKPLADGVESAEWLAKEILHAIAANDAEALQFLRITYDEFAEILWPEMPQSRPVTNIQAEDAWFFLVRECLSAVNGALGEWGGQRLRFERLSFDEGLTRYPNYNLYQGIHIHAHRPDGEAVDLDFAHTFVEKDGVWKVYIYKD